MKSYLKFSITVIMVLFGFVFSSLLAQSTKQDVVATHNKIIKKKKHKENVCYIGDEKYTKRQKRKMARERAQEKLRLEEYKKSLIRVGCPSF